MCEACPHPDTDSSIGGGTPPPTPADRGMVGSAAAGAGAAKTGAVVTIAGLGTELSGSLPCVVCRYDLRGLSILGTCPECGTLIRATLLAKIDPHARELAPIRHRTAVVACLVLWPGAALLAALFMWMPQVADALKIAGLPATRPDLRIASLVALSVSGVAALGLVRPHGRIPWSTTLLALVGVAAYLPLMWAVNRLWIHAADAWWAGRESYLGGWIPDERVELARLMMVAMVVMVTLGMRPAARVLVARSLIIRSGRVDRQTLAALALAASIGALGDALAIMSPTVGEGAARIIAMLLIVCSSVLLTMGLVGALRDCVRIASAIIRPMPTLEELLAKEE